MSRGFQHNHEAWRSYHVDFMLLAKRVYFALVAPDRDKGGADSIAEIRRWLSERDATAPVLPLRQRLRSPRALPTRAEDIPTPLHRCRPLASRARSNRHSGLDGDAERKSALAQRHRAGRDLLDGAIAAADAVLGQVLELVGDDPIVVVASDHGELFGEHTLFGHSNTLYEPLIRIPLLVAGESLPEGLVVQEIVSLTDIAPTLLAMAEAPAPEVDGSDLAPLFSAGEEPGQRQVRAEQFRPMASAHGWPHNRPAEIRYLFARKQAVVSRSLKRIVAADGSDSGYDLATDPGEERPFRGAETNLKAHIPEPQATEKDVEFDPLQRKMLEMLGYLQ